MENEMGCSFCGYFGEMEPVHGKIQCPQCKQMPPMGDCCQSAQLNEGEKVCSQLEKQ